MKVGLAITTCRRDCAPGRLEITHRSLKSLFDSKPKLDACYLIDDSSESTKVFDAYPLQYVHKKRHGGVACAKNTCIRLLYEAGCDIIILADDDVLWKKGWDTAYVKVLEKTGIQHMCWYGGESSKLYKDENLGVKKVIVKDVLLLQTQQANGQVLFCTRHMIDTIGYYRMLPNWHGYGHAEYSLRCRGSGLILNFYDIPDSEKYISLVPESTKVTTWDWADDTNENKYSYNTYDFEYVPCIEYRKDLEFPNKNNIIKHEVGLMKNKTPEQIKPIETEIPVEKQIPEELGILSERTTEKLNLANCNIFVWDNTPGRTPTVLDMKHYNDGSKCCKVICGENSWSGWGIAPKEMGLVIRQGVDMTPYKGGKLHFYIKGDAPSVDVTVGWNPVDKRSN